MADFTIVNAGEKLQVGQIPTDFPGLGSKLLPGTAVINGPVFIGAAIQGGVPTAACMIGPPLGVSLPLSLDVKGFSNFAGNTTTLGVSQFLGASIKSAADLSNGIKVNTGSHVSSENKVISGNLVVSGTITSAQNVFAPGGDLNGKKPFDIPHPTKNGWRLRYVCLEGPTADVYIKGRLNNKNIIELPDYWIKLVDAETISVNLTPIGSYQELYVDKIEWGTRIYIKNNSGAAVKCYYTVYAERKDTSKNITEYEGDYEDYPGNNDEYILSAIRRK